MSASAPAHQVAAPTREPPPSLIAGPLAWMRANLFNSWISTAVTLGLGYIVFKFAVGFIAWAFIHAVWTVPEGANGRLDPSACRAAQGIGACWAVIWDKYRFITFGRYPYDQQWRPLIVIVLFIGLFVASGMRRFWRTELAYLWIVTLTVIFTLMWGGVFGMRYVPQDVWGGLPITLILSTFGLAAAFPLAVLVALGRRATTMPAVRLICVVYIELIRGVPLITLLFMSSVMFPLFMPVGLNPDKLLRAQVAIILFAGAYLAEVVRAGLQGLPKGQYEAADALGLSYWKKMGFVVLPQALRLVIPPLVNTFIGFFKDTSLVLIIGIFDLLTAGKVALADPIWQAYSTEVYIVLAIVYFLFCFSMSRYSKGLEREFSKSVRR
jgi:general L-amino acid transport system permease protein